MSGHSKWSTIKRKKGAADAKRGKAFSKIIRELTVAARVGGSDPHGNSRLRIVVDKAKAANMPRDNIERAIKKGTGELEGESYEEVSYEGYAPGGVALLIEVMTDNKNRTVSDIRHTLTKMGGLFIKKYYFENKPMDFALIHQTALKLQNVLQHQNFHFQDFYLKIHCPEGHQL